MRHRIGGGLSGIGNPYPPKLSNQGELKGVLRKMARAATKLYFQEWGGCDFQIIMDGKKMEAFEVGIEPAYQYDRLKIISINREKRLSFIMEGRAWGDYGSGLAVRRKYYKEFKYRCKFVRFIDEWHGLIFKK